MKRILNTLLNRITITVLLLTIQINVICVAFIKFSDSTEWFPVISSTLSIIILFYIIGNDQNPAYKLSWIVFILVFPVFGGLLYLTMGNKRPGKQLRKKLLNEEINSTHVFDDMIDVTSFMQPRIASLSRYITENAPYPAYKNTIGKYYSLGDCMYKDMIDELNKAEKFIFLEYFIICDGKMWNGILDVLKKKALAGIDVRLLYDDVGCIKYFNKENKQKLKSYGIKCIAFNPFIPILSLSMNNRDHRKIMNIDGKVAFSGGINLGDEYINEIKRFGHWKDTGFMLKGEAVKNYTVMFLRMWNAFCKTDLNYSDFYSEDIYPEGDGFFQPFCDSPLDNECVSENIYMDILAQAERYVYIFTPYLIIDNELLTCISLAAKRGVDVRIVLPGIPDKKIIFKLSHSYYNALLGAGVKIYEYSPGFLHAKSFVSDDKIAVVGSINMDFRSLYLHFECGCFMYNTSIINDIKKDFEDTLSKSVFITKQTYRFSIFDKFIDSLLRFLSPLL